MGVRPGRAGFRRAVAAIQRAGRVSATRSTLEGLKQKGVTQLAGQTIDQQIAALTAQEPKEPEPPSEGILSSTFNAMKPLVDVCVGDSLEKIGR